VHKTLGTVCLPWQSAVSGIPVSRHANLPAFGGIILLSGHISAIPRGINEIRLFKAILFVTES